MSDISRRQYSEQRLDKLRSRLHDLDGALATTGLSVYATGSYGRLEAWEDSDIDLFFIYDNPTDFSLLTFLRLAGRLVEITDEMKFPPFSGDGRYLESLDADEMERVLGSREDDSTNAFTARMLLLLESRPVSNDEQYARLIDRVAGFYYRDYADHELDFVPTFLLNDILRFWRTLTLNYEHDRAHAGDSAEATAKSAIKNYKLKLSRLLTCFSMVLHLASEKPPVTQRRVVELCAMTPRERLNALRGRSSSADTILDRLDAHYDAFLDEIQVPKADLIARFSAASERQRLFREGAAFGKEVYDLLRELAPDDRLRTLVI